MLFVGGPQAEQFWIAELLAGADDTDPSTQECRRSLEVLAARTCEELRGSQMEFRLLLPDSSSSLAVRALALYDWNRGFLYGLGLVGMDVGRLSGHAREAFDDFASITHLDLDDLEDSEDNEQALMELTEFVRVAAMLVYEEQGRPGAPGG